MTKTLSLLTTLSLLFCSMSFAQNGSIIGTITDHTQVPLTGVNIVIKHTPQGTQSDIDGNFEIINISNGSYTLVISYIGFKTREVPFSISNNTTNNLGTLTLYEGNELLSEVILNGERKNKFSRKKTAYVSKLPLKDLENSQVYSTVTSELLESQIVTNFDDAIKNATGISKLWESTGRNPGTGTGYFSVRGFSTQPGLVDGLPGFTFSAVDPSYIERIEVVKGPAATLFGSTVTSLGGLINVVTKKPYEGFGGGISYTTGSFGMHRISGDINTPLGDKNAPYFRMNTSYLTQDSFQDAGFRKTFFTAPSLTYRLNNRLNLSFGIEYSNTEQTNPSMLFLRRGLPLVSKKIEEINLNPDKSFTSNDLTLTNSIFNSRAIVDYKISNSWSSHTIFASTYSKVHGYYQYLSDGSAAAFLSLQPLTDIPFPPLQNSVNDILGEASALLSQEAFTRIYDHRDGAVTKYNIQQNFTGDFKMGSLRNRMVIGLDFVHREKVSRNKSANPVLTQNSNFPFIIQTLNALEAGQGDTLASRFAAFPYFDGFFSPNGHIIPTTFTPNTKYNVTKADLDVIFDQIPENFIETGSQSFAAYISDVINITDKLTLSVGLRLDHFDQKGDTSNPSDDYTKTTVSPSAGIVFQPVLNKLTLFSNYQTGFINADPEINNDGSVTTFKPTKARQFEGGVKTNLINGKLNMGISYYHIIVNDRGNSDPRAPLFPIRIDMKELISKGFELEVNTNPLSGLNLRASYAFNDTKITDPFSRIRNINYTELQDRRPEASGPETIYNFWADYKFDTHSILKNFGLGVGFNGASEHLTVNNAVTGEFTLPSYIIYNASAYYDTDKIRIGFKVNNLTDETYYNGWSTINVQAPRTFVGTIGYKF